MTRYECSGCGLRSCEGQCYLECPADHPIEEVSAPLEPYEPSPEYLAWIEKIDGDPLLKSRRAA